MRRAAAVTVALAWLTGLAIVEGHHGIANFDVNREIELSGTVTELRLINPHSWLHLEVTSADGRVTPWRCELRGASVLRRSGWTADMFRPGTRVVVTGAPDRFTPNTCYLGTAVFADGRRIDRYGQLRAAEPASPASGRAATARPARRPDGRPNLAGDWAAEQRMLTDPRGMAGAFLPMSVAKTLEPGSVPEGTQAFPGARGTEVSLAQDPIDAYWKRPIAFPLTEAGRRAIEPFDGASADNPRLRCEPTNILFDWTFETDVNRITQDDRRITLQYGSMGMERTIHLDLSEHPKNLTPSRAGHSIGRWEGDELVVDTVGFAPGILSADARIPHSDQLHVVERFTLDPARGAITRRWVADDPLYLQQPYTGADTVYPADVPYAPAPCDDQSYKTVTTASSETPASSEASSGDPSSGTPSSTATRLTIGIALAAAVIVGVAVWHRRRRGAA